MKKTTKDLTFLEAGYIREYMEKVLSKAGVRDDVSCHVAEGLAGVTERCRFSRYSSSSTLFKGSGERTDK